MKILHITPSYKPAFIYGGPIYSISALCEALNAEGERIKVESLKQKAESRNSLVNQLSANHNQNNISIKVYTTLANGKKELSYQNGETKIVDGIEVTYFKRLTKDHSHFSPSLLWHLWNNIKNYEVVHIHAWWNLVSMGAVLICLIRGVKPIISPRGMFGDYTFSSAKLIFHKTIGKLLLKKCNFHATTSMEANEIVNRVFGSEDNVQIENLELEIPIKKTAPNSLSKIFIIHNIVSLPINLPFKTRVFDGELKLIFLSRVHHKKGIESLLEALSLLDFPFNLTIVGEGNLHYTESLKQKAKSKKLDEKINWMGAIYGDEKFKLLAEHDLLVLPSYNENFANVVIESLAVKTPVLISEMVGLSTWVSQNNYGLVCKNSPHEIAIKLNEFYKSIFDGYKFQINNFNTYKNTVLYLYAYERI